MSIINKKFIFISLLAFLSIESCDLKIRKTPFASTSNSSTESLSKGILIRKFNDFNIIFYDSVIIKFYDSFLENKTYEKNSENKTKSVEGVYCLVLNYKIEKGDLKYYVNWEIEYFSDNGNNKVAGCYNKSIDTLNLKVRRIINNRERNNPIEEVNVYLLTTGEVKVINDFGWNVYKKSLK
ncbi:MAG: hypothetical protein SFU91_05055 [Chloroherpetonaceae bacterium]|nr:hypothetical protein [Chloroherpetonaceae bacterium]